MTLPIHAVEDEIAARLSRGNRLVIVAPTGSGKTTQVPQILLRRVVAKGQVWVLQPRRLAARLLARRVAAEMGTVLGDGVGYQTRHDSRVGPHTRLRFLTEGLLLRLLRERPGLEGVDALILDEFHERSLALDASLGLVRRLQETRRPDLKLVVMSATIDAERVAAHLDCPVVNVEARAFPVEVGYLAHATAAPCWDLAAEALRGILQARRPGDVLVFLPGAYEIRRTLDAFRATAARAGESPALLELHGDMPPERQDEALQPRAERRVIAATNVAQTSITVDGVRHVIDTGLARVHRFDPLRGVNSLRVEPISRAAADQRAGRAGRTAPGSCARLWTERQHRERAEQDEPEIRRVDLAGMWLDLRGLGVDRPESFEWLEPPEPARAEQAESVLRMLAAIDVAGRLTPAGETMAALPLHPRLARLLLEAAKTGALDHACRWAAYLGERDILDRRRARERARRSPESEASDFVVLDSAFADAAERGFRPDYCREAGIHASACREVERTAALYRRACRAAGLESRPGEGRLEDLLGALLAAYPDHLAAQLHPGARGYELAGGRTASLDEASAVRDAPLVLAVEREERVSGKHRATSLWLASRIDPAWVLERFPDRVEAAEETRWNAEARAVERVSGLRFDGLWIERTVRPEGDPDRAAAILVEQIRAGALRPERWDDAVDQWIERTRCTAAWFPDRGLPGYDESDLRVVLLEWCAGATRFNQVKDRPVLEPLKSALSWEDRQFVERMAPATIVLAGGRSMKLEYAVGRPPKGRAKIQDLYDTTETPRVAGGKVAVLLEILGPNFRPVQTTEDLAGFWERLYPEVRKELKRRYPKHEWR